MKKEQTMEIGYIECPCCNYKVESLEVEDKELRCDQCGNIFESEELIIKTRTYPYVTCKQCDIDVILTESNINTKRDSYICPICWQKAASVKKS